MQNLVLKNLPKYLNDCPHEESHSQLSVLTSYFQHNTGSRFESYGENDPYRITGDDLVAVTMLSMEIRARSTSGFTPRIAINLEDESDRLSGLLKEISQGTKDGDLSRWSLELTDKDSLEMYFLNQDSPAQKLVELLFLILQTDRNSVTRKWVAVSKLLSRKFPSLLPIRDNKVADLLGYERPYDQLTYLSHWWRDWHEAFFANGAQIIQRLTNLQQDLEHQLEKQTGTYFTPSLVRIADVLVWNSCNCTRT